MEFKAVQKYLVNSHKKIREILPMIKNLKPLDAVERLPFVGKKAAEPLIKTISSAIANAKQKGVEGKDLIFKEIQINEGPRLKRFKAGARGRVKPFRRRMSHIRVVLTTSKSEILNPKSEINSKGKNKEISKTRKGGK